MQIKCRLAHQSEREAITCFLDEHWGSKHPLIHCEDFFQHYYVKDDVLQFGVAESDGEIQAVAGYILANETEQPDIWISIWCAKKGSSGAGLQLMSEMKRLTNANVVACNNIRPKTLSAYRFLGFTAERLPHYYRLGKQEQFQIAKIQQAQRLPVTEGKKLQAISTIEELEKKMTVPTQIAPKKDVWYLNRRYFNYPGQKYQVWAIDTNLLVTRTVCVEGVIILRIVDYIGEPQDFIQFGYGIDALMQEIHAEYADCYCAGISSEIMEQAGFSQRTQDSENIIPNYLDPPVYENTEYYYFTSQTDHFLMMKADGDQDRPNREI